MIESLIDWLVNLIDVMGYAGVAFAMFIESFFAPIPSELIMPFAGFLTASGDMNLVLLTLIGGFASYLGSLPFYFIGYWGNDLVVDKFLKNYGKYFFIDQGDVDMGFKVFDKYGNSIVLIGRLIPIIRTVISFPAGVAKMNLWEFSLYTIIGSVVWSGFLASAGYFLGDNYEVIIDYLSAYENVILGLGVAAVVGFVGYKVWKKRK